MLSSVSFIPRGALAPSTSKRTEGGFCKRVDSTPLDWRDYSTCFWQDCRPITHYWHKLIGASQALTTICHRWHEILTYDSNRQALAVHQRFHCNFILPTCPGGMNSWVETFCSGLWSPDLLNTCVNMCWGRKTTQTKELARHNYVCVCVYVCQWSVHLRQLTPCEKPNWPCHQRDSNGASRGRQHLKNTTSFSLIPDCTHVLISLTHGP